MIDIPVLDKGYVKHKDNWFLGSGDLEVVNDARVSFNRESNKLNDADIRLIKYLAKHKHTSPFRHSVMKFEIYMPLMVARQFYKHIIGAGFEEGSMSSFNAFNESSRRYIIEGEEFYLPSDWRLAPEGSVKQGSGLNASKELNTKISQKYASFVLEGEKLYKEALADGVCAEQARLFLPAYGLYVRVRWTSSLQAISNFLIQRLDDHAQWEIREYAKAMSVIVEQRFPESIKVLVDYEVK